MRGIEVGDAYRVNAGSLPLREYPEPGAPALTLLARGQILRRVDMVYWNGAWLRVFADVAGDACYEGYIHADEAQDWDGDDVDASDRARDAEEERPRDAEEAPPSPPPPPADPSPAIRVEIPAGFLSPNFSLAELIASETAARNQIDNTPPAAILENLRRTAAYMEKVRSILGDAPIHVTSGFRCLAVNRLIKSSDASHHVQGYAVDFQCPKVGNPFKVASIIAASGLMSEIDDLIHEFGGWVHISFDPRKRRMLRTFAHNSKPRTGILPLDSTGRFPPDGA